MGQLHPADAGSGDMGETAHHKNIITERTGDNIKFSYTNIYTYTYRSTNIQTYIHADSQAAGHLM